MSASLRLPRVVVTAAAAELMLARLPSADSLAKITTAELTIFARALSTTSRSFVAALAAGIEHRGYRIIILKGAPRELQSMLQEECKSRGLQLI